MDQDQTASYLGSYCKGNVKYSKLFTIMTPWVRFWELEGPKLKVCQKHKYSVHECQIEGHSSANLKILATQGLQGNPKVGDWVGFLAICVDF